MKAFTLFIFFLVIVANIFAQNQLVRIKAGEDANTVLAKEIYTYPEFRQGTVYFRDGKVSGGRLNYDMLVHEMHFIGQNGDTLALSNAKTIRVIAIGNDSFFYDNFFLKQIASGESIRLLKRQRLKIVDKQKIGAYDQPTSNSSISSYNSLTSGATRYNLNIKEDLLMDKETMFYFANRYGSFLPANRKGLLKLLGKKQEYVENYIAKNQPDFNNETDLMKMIAALNQQ